MDASGHLQDFVTAGVSPEEYQRFLHLPHGPGLWEYLRQVPQPLRLRDLAAHLGPLGFPDDPTLARSFLGTPIPTPGRAGGQLLSGRQGRRARVHPGGRGGPGAVRVPGRGGDRQRPPAPGRAAGAGRPGGPGRHVTGGRRGPRCPDRPSGLAQPGGQADRRRAGPAGPLPGATARGPVLAACRREGALHGHLPPAGGAAQRHDGARRGDRALGSRRAACHDVGQRHADPGRGRGGRLHGGHHAGSGAAGGAGAVAGRVPESGEPRAAGAAGRDQGLGRDRAGWRAGAGPGRDAPVFPDHQRASRSHARPDQRPAGCGAHRGGHAVGHPRAGGRGGPGGAGPEDLPERRRPAHRPDRPARRICPGCGPTGGASSRC